MTDNNCIFCKIVSGDIPGAIAYRDEQATAFRDINPVAPTHILIVPNRHIESVATLEEADEPWRVGSQKKRRSIKQATG